MKKQQTSMIPIKSIRIAREIHAGDDLLALVQDITNRDGITFPVLIEEESNLLIDGLRRIKAYEILGKTEIPAIIVTDFDTMAGHHIKTLKNGVAARRTTPRRIWEFYLDTARLRKARTSTLRQRPVSVRVAAPAAPNPMFLAFPDQSEATIGASLAAYRLFEHAGNEPDIQAVYDQVRQDLEAGQYTIFQARNRMGRNTGRRMLFTGSITGAAEQRNVMVAALDGFAGTNSALQRLGEIDPDVNALELAAYIKGFEKQRRGIQDIIRNLRRAATKL